MSWRPRILWFYHAPHNPEVADLLEGRINGLLKAGTAPAVPSAWPPWVEELMKAVGNTGVALVLPSLGPCSSVPTCLPCLPYPLYCWQAPTRSLFNS